MVKIGGEKIRREQVGTVPTFLSVRTNKYIRQVENGFTVATVRHKLLLFKLYTLLVLVLSSLFAKYGALFVSIDVYSFLPIISDVPFDFVREVFVQ